MRIVREIGIDAAIDVAPGVVGLLDMVGIVGVNKVFGDLPVVEKDKAHVPPRVAQLSERVHGELNIVVSK